MTEQERIAAQIAARIAAGAVTKVAPKAAFGADTAQNRAARNRAAHRNSGLTTGRVRDPRGREFD